MKDILLIYPGRFEGLSKKVTLVGLGLLILSYHLKKNGYSPTIFDQRADSLDTFKNLLKSKNWFAAGISAKTGYQLKHGLELAQLIRKRNPSLPIVWGGPHATLAPKTLLSSPLCDYTVLGEGEQSFVSLLDCLQEKKRLNDIKGIGYKPTSTNIQLSYADSFWQWKEPEYIPFDGISPQRYFPKQARYETSRGCTYRCHYCTQQTPMRYKSLDIVKQELNYIFQERNIKKQSSQEQVIQLIDNNLLANIPRAYQIFEFLSVWNLMIFTYFRANDVCKLPPDFLKLLTSFKKKISIYLGGGFGCDDLNIKVRKEMTEKEIIRSAHIVSKFKNATNIYGFLCGHPEEKEEHLQKKKKLINSLFKTRFNVVMFHLNWVIPYPSTQIYQLFKNLGIKVPSTLEEWSQLPDSSLSYITWSNKKLIRKAQFYGTYVFLTSLFRLFVIDGTLHHNKKKLIFAVLIFPFKIFLSIRWILDFDWWFLDLWAVQKIRYNFYSRIT